MPTLWVMCCHYHPFSRWQWLRNMPQVTRLNSRGELQTLTGTLHPLPLWSSYPCALPGYCFEVRIFSAEAYHLTHSPGNWRGFSQMLWTLMKASKTKTAKKKPRSESQLSNFYTEIGKSGQGGSGQWMREVSIFCQVHAYKYYPLKVVSPAPIRKPRKYHHLMTLPWEHGRTSIPNEQVIYSSCCSMKLRSCCINTAQLLSSILGWAKPYLPSTLSNGQEWMD